MSVKVLVLIEHIQKKKNSLKTRIINIKVMLHKKYVNFKVNF